MPDLLGVGFCNSRDCPTTPNLCRNRPYRIFQPPQASGPARPPPGDGAFGRFKSVILRNLVLVLACVVLSMDGCLLLPIPTKENIVLSGKPITEEEIAFMIPKVTTQQEVVERLGNPGIIWEDARVFVYNWEMRQGVFFWAVGAYYTGAAGMEDIPKHYLLLIQFDEQARIQRFDRAVRPLTQSYIHFLEEWLKASEAQPPPHPE